MQKVYSHIAHCVLFLVQQNGKREYYIIGSIFFTPKKQRKQEIL